MTERKRDRKTEIQKDRDTERQRDKKTERQKNRKTEKQRDRKDRQTNRKVANKELFDETQRLSDKECQWAEEKATLESELVRNFVMADRKKDRYTDRQIDR
jgi:hypothetical protein